MDHSLEGLAKERGARYTKFEFTGAKRPPNTQSSQLQSPQSKTSPQGFREEPLDWVGPVNLDVEATSATGLPISARTFPCALATQAGFSFFAGSLFLCIALLVYEMLPVGTFANLRTVGHFGADRASELVYRLPELSAPIVVFGIASILSFGYFLSWTVRLLIRIFCRLFRQRKLNK